jgi:hypothetical protein
MNTELDRLHYRYKQGSNIPRSRWEERQEDNKDRYLAYVLEGVKFTSNLPFSWEVIVAVNCSNNHQGNTHGSEHVVLKEDFRSGRLIRSKGMPLCGANLKDLWGIPSRDCLGATCKKCLKTAEKITSKRSPLLKS